MIKKTTIIKSSIFLGCILSGYRCDFNSDQNTNVTPVIALDEEVIKDSSSIFEVIDFIPLNNLNFGLDFMIFGKDTTAKPFPFFEFSDSYSLDTVSIFCFRGNHFRNNASRGKVVGTPIELKLDWEFVTGYDTTTTTFGKWGGGSGWTGQPCAIKWSKQEKINLGITDKSFLEDKDAFEIIIGSLCGDIYFLDAKDGKPTREALTINNPIKGSVSVDPRKNGLLYVGQGIPHTDRFGAYVFDMISRKEVFHISGNDRDSKRYWGAFDSNPIIDYKTGQAIWPAENGLIYKFSIDNDLNFSQPTKMLYNHTELFRRGIESSMAAIGGYGFFLDNSGSIICINLNTFEPIWNVSNFDDSDATAMVDYERAKGYFLYTGNEVDKLAPFHDSYFRKIDARNGDEIWKISRTCYGTPLRGQTNSGGILASPVLGKNKGNDLVYCIFSRVDEKHRGEIVAVNKHSGKEMFSVYLDNYTWASPVDFYDENGNIYIFFTDVSGTVYVIDGITGNIIFKEKTKYTFEASPIIIQDKIFLAARGRYILSFKIITKTE